MIHVASDYTSKLLVQLKISKHIRGSLCFPAPGPLLIPGRSPGPQFVLPALALNLYLPVLASNLDFPALTKNNSFTDSCP